MQIPNNGGGFNPYHVPSVVINSVMLIPTKEYNNVYNRSLEINATPTNMMYLENTIADQLSRSSRISPIALANNVPDIIKISDMAGSLVNIANGWSTIRLRFVIEVEKQTGPGTWEICYVQGFTDYHDPSIRGKIDPNMPMHINSITNVIRNITPDNRVMTRVVGSFNILSDPYGTGYTVENTTQKHKLLRPKDISDGIQKNSMVGFNNIETTDIRSTYGSGIPSESKRTNSISSVNLAEVFNAFIYAKEATSIGYDVDDLFNPASSKLNEQQMLRTSFVEAISNITGMPGTVTFNLNMLQMLRPDVESILVYADNTTPMYNQNAILDSNNTERLDGFNIESTIANTLAENVSSLLLEELLSTISFSITNMTPNSELVHSITYANSFIHGIDIVIYAERFIDKLKTLVMPGITKHNMIGVELFVHADIVGDTTIAVGINGAQPIVYRLPTFCNSLYTPIISNENNYNVVVGDMTNMLTVAGIQTY